MAGTFKEFKDNGYSISTVTDFDIVEILSENGNGEKSKSLISSEELAPFIKQISFLLDDNDMLSFSCNDDYTKDSIVFIKRSREFVICVEKFNKDKYEVTVAFFNDETDSYDLVGSKLRYLSDPDSCVQWLTKVLANGKFVLENI